MGTVNRAIILGHLGHDPEVKQTTNGTPVANFSVATSETWTDANGQRQERTEWHRVVVFGKAATNCGAYLEKGRSVYVEGRIQTREWEDKEGQKRKTTEVIADRVVFLGDGRGREGQAGSERGRERDRGDRDRGPERGDEGRGQGRLPVGDPWVDDDIPF